MDQTPSFSGSDGVQSPWGLASSEGDNARGGVSVHSDSNMSDYPSEEEDEDPYTRVEFSDPQASPEEFIQLSSRLRTDGRNLGRYSRQANVLAEQELLNGTQLSAAGKSHYSQRLEDAAAQMVIRSGELRSSMQVVQSSALYADGRRAQSEVNDRHHELERSERSLARQQDALERRLVRLADEKETLRDDRETLEQQQNVLDADLLNFRVDCVEYNNRVSDFNDEQAEMQRKSARLERQVDAYNERAAQQDEQGEDLERRTADLERKIADLHRREAAFADARAAAQEEDQRLAAERAQLVTYQRSVAEASDLVPQLQQWIGQGRTIFDHAETVLEGLQGARARPQEAMPPQGPHTPNMEPARFPPAAPDFPPAAHLFHTSMQYDAGPAHNYNRQGQQSGQPQQDNFWLDPNQDLGQHGAQDVLSPYLRPFGSEEQGLQGGQSSLSPYLRPFPPVQQQTPYTGHEQVYGYNAPVGHQQQHRWFPAVPGSSFAQPIQSNEERMALHLNANVRNFNSVPAEENIAPRRYWPEQNVPFYDGPEHSNRAPVSPSEPNRFGPFELDAQQDGHREVSGPSQHQEYESQHQDSDEVDLIDLDSEPEQDDQVLVDLDESDSDSESDSDDEAPVNHDWDGTIRNDIDHDADNYEDDVDPIDID